MASTEYTYTRGEFKVTEQMTLDFERDGFIIIRHLLDDEELENLKVTIENPDGGLRERAFHQDDGGGLKVTMIHWKHPGTDVSGIIARSRKVAGTFEKLLGGEVYHYSGKINMKEAHSGGQHLWHQDYGYWYNNGLLFPDMATVYIAVDKADKTNGCLQVLRGSHLAGRVEHKRVAGETGADEERVNQLKKVLDHVYVELDPGDAVLFHCNVLHRSDQNRSDRRRRAYLVSYNRASNNPVFEHYNASYVPLEIVDDEEIKRCSNHTDFTGKSFVDPADNKNISGTKTGKH
ncbi:L-proline trans-4-hydroxylase-like [Branchiostoma floridae x Branchiostoma japonicum]